MAFDRLTTNELALCHDYVSEEPEFNDLPKAALSFFPGWDDGDKLVIFWNVHWDHPVVKRAGNCTVINGVVEVFEDYTRML